MVGPDGIEIAADDDGGDGTDSLLAVRPPLDGRYTLWVSSDRSGARKCTVRLLDAE